MSHEFVDRLEEAIGRLRIDEESCAPSEFNDVCRVANACRDIRIAWGLGQCQSTDLLLNLLVERTEWMLTTYSPETVLRQELDGHTNTGIVTAWRATWELWRERATA